MQDKVTPSKTERLIEAWERDGLMTMLERWAADDAYYAAQQNDEQDATAILREAGKIVTVCEHGFDIDLCLYSSHTRLPS